MVSELQHRYDQLGQEIMKYTTVKISEIRKLQEGIDYEVDNIDDYIKRVKSHKLQASSNKLLDT